MIEPLAAWEIEMLRADDMARTKIDTLCDVMGILEQEGCKRAHSIVLGMLWQAEATSGLRRRP